MQVTDVLIYVLESHVLGSNSYTHTSMVNSTVVFVGLCVRTCHFCVSYCHCLMFR